MMLPFGIKLTLLSGIGIIVGVFLLALLVRFIAAYVSAPEGGRKKESRFEIAADNTGKWLAAVGIGLLSTIGLLIANGFDIIAMFMEFVGQHPFAASNLAVVGLGAAIIEGLAALSTSQYVGIALGIMAITLLATVVYD